MRGFDQPSVHRRIRLQALLIAMVFAPWVEAGASEASISTALSQEPVQRIDQGSMRQPPADAISGGTQVIVVRHAEQLAPGSENPDLAPEGWRRAEALRDTLAGFGLDAIYTADLCRSVQTVVPLARARSLPILVRRFVSEEVELLEGCTDTSPDDLEVLDESFADWTGLADFVVRRHRAERVLVVGHTTTIPILLQRLMGTETRRPKIALEVFDDLFIVTIPTVGSPAMIHAKYGSPATGWSTPTVSP